MGNEKFEEVLKAPFRDQDLDWRIMKSGLSKPGSPWAIVVPYVDARAVQDRLDEAVGMENWSAHYVRSEKGVMCLLSVRIGPDWITKEDGSEDTEIEPFKGGISKALVRAASVWGVGRYLYQEPIHFAKFVASGTPHAKEVKIGDQWYSWLPPSLSTPLTAPPPPPPVSVPPPPGPSSPSSSGASGEFVIPFGVHKGKKISQVKKEDLQSYAAWLQAKSKQDQKPLSKSALMLVMKINESCSSSDSHFPNEEDVL